MANNQGTKFESKVAQMFNLIFLPKTGCNCFRGVVFVTFLEK